MKKSSRYFIIIFALLWGVEKTSGEFGGGLDDMFGGDFDLDGMMQELEKAFADMDAEGKTPKGSPTAAQSSAGAGSTQGEAAAGESKTVITPALEDYDARKLFITPAFATVEEKKAKRQKLTPHAARSFHEIFGGAVNRCLLLYEKLVTNHDISPELISQAGEAIAHFQVYYAQLRSKALYLRQFFKAAPEKKDSSAKKPSTSPAEELRKKILDIHDEVKKLEPRVPLITLERQEKDDETALQQLAQEPKHTKKKSDAFAPLAPKTPKRRGAQPSRSFSREIFAQ